MGEIFKQSVKGSLYIYVGVGLGFVISGILYPKLLTTEQIGLISTLIAYSTLISTFGNLGMGQVITRLFPYFRSEKDRHHGFMMIPVLISSGGFLVMASLFFIFKDFIIAKGSGESLLFARYYNLIIPLVFFSMAFVLLDNYVKVLFNPVKGTFYQEIIKRIFVLIAILLFYFEVYHFSGFVYGYIAAAAIPFLGVLSHLIIQKKLHIFPNFSHISKKMWKEIIDVALFGILAGASGILILQIDKIMVLGITEDMGATGVYTIAFFFGSLVQKPAKALNRISSVFIAESWKKNELDEIHSIYRKTAINQILIGLILVIGLVVNLENILEFLGDDYREGGPVIVLIAVAFLVDLMTGSAGTVINTSPSYRWNAYLLIGLVVIVLISNLIFIPMFGIAGAALATLVSKVLFNVSRIVFIYLKWRIQPYNPKVLYTGISGLAAFAVGWFFPEMENYILDIIVRSTLTAATYGLAVLILRPSEDVDYWLKKFREKYF